MFHGDAVNPRINHPQETWQNPRFLSTFMGDSWGFPFDPQLRRRFRTLPRLNRQRASQILDMLGITTEDRLFKSFQPPNVCWLNHPNCWWNHLKSLKSGWVLLAVAALPGPNACGCCPLGENNSEGRDSISMATWCDLRWPEKAQEIFIKHMRSYENVVFQVFSGSNSCYLLHLVRFTGHFQKANRCTSNTKWQVSEVTEVPAPAPAPEAIQLERLYSENFDQYQTVKNNINDLWTMFEKVSLSPLSVNWGCLNQLWTPETMRSIEKPIIFDLRSLVYNSFFVMNLIIRSPWSMMVKLAPVGQCILAGPAESQSLPSRNAMQTHQQSYPNICQWSRIFRPWFIDLYIHYMIIHACIHASMHPSIHPYLHPASCIHAIPCHLPAYLPTCLPTYLPNLPTYLRP